MKLIIQIPCFNEEEALPIALSELPRRVEGVDKLEVLIVDDGSTDDTVNVAKTFGVDHIVSIPENKGLANAYMTGLDACLKAGADIIVNTDADNQYKADDIDKLVEPIIEKRADIVIGTRPILETAHFSLLKKLLQMFGSWVVRFASETDVEDAPSGFRAISRETAKKLYVFNKYTYTLETIIQAGQSGMKIVSVPVRTNSDLRPSRLVKSMWSYVQRSIGTILRIFVIYRPVKSFFMIGMVPFLVGFCLGLRWLVLTYIGESGRTHLPSLILSAILLIIGFQTFLFGLSAELIAANRKLLEEIRSRLRSIELDDSK